MSRQKEDAGKSTEDHWSQTPGGFPEKSFILKFTAQNTNRKLPAISPATSVNIPNHLPLHESQNQVPGRADSQPGYSDDSGEPILQNNTTHTVSKDPEISLASAAREEVRPSTDDKAKPIMTTTTTRMQTPVSCQVNLTGPDGYIEAPPAPRSSLQSPVECRFIITVYLGYGVEVQVMNVGLTDRDKVVFEDLGLQEQAILANESVLMRGLVVRSQSNQISIHFRSPHSPTGSVLLKYEAFLLSCVFPGRPPHGDVTVTSVHSGGKAFFSCFSGYHLQGPTVLHCRNASSPYWSGPEPQCLAACGGFIRNATVGRIVSPGFPTSYSNNLTCRWMLDAGHGQRLHIHFEKVALAEDDDRLLIKNGNSVDATVLYDSYEVEYLPAEGLISASRRLLIEMTTDATGSSTGIAIRYQAFSAGHCYQPFVRYGNLSSSDPSWAVGTVVEFTCDLGYTLEQGSVSIECIDPENPQWNETEPACRAVCSGEMTDSAGVLLSPNWPEPYDKGQDCIWGIHVDEEKRIMLDIQVLNMGKNDLLTFYDGDDLTAKLLAQYGGSKLRFKLYTSSADVTIQFQSDPATDIYGFGSGFVIHFFEVARNDTCPELPDIANGWKTTSHPELVQGTVATYQCHPGYQVAGAEVLMCQWDLTWSGDMPSCERVVNCADPGQVENSRRVPSNPRFIVGSTIQYICNEGFTLSGNSLLTCLTRRSSEPRWSQNLPKCLPEIFEACSHPGTPVYGTPSSLKRHFQAGETLHYSCLPSHRLEGDAELQCIPGHPPQWSALPPVCKKFVMKDAHPALAGLLFVALVLILIIWIGGFSKINKKPLLVSSSSNQPYENLAGESSINNTDYETRGTKEYEVSI